MYIKTANDKIQTLIKKCFDSWENNIILFNKKKNTTADDVSSKKKIFV